MSDDLKQNYAKLNAKYQKLQQRIKDIEQEQIAEMKEHQGAMKIADMKIKELEKENKKLSEIRIIEDVERLGKKINGVFYSDEQLYNLAVIGQLDNFHATNLIKEINILKAKLKSMPKSICEEIYEKAFDVKLYGNYELQIFNEIHNSAEYGQVIGNIDKYRLKIILSEIQKKYKEIRND